MVVKGMWAEFKAFALGGNMLDLALGFIIGTAFASLVDSLAGDVIMQFVAAIFGQPDFSGLTFTINDSLFRYGEFLNALIAFVLIAAVLFLLVIKPVNAILERRKMVEEPTTRECPECLSEIPLAARRCAYCSVEVGASS